MELENLEFKTVTQRCYWNQVDPGVRKTQKTRWLIKIYYQYLKVDFSGKQVDFPKYKIQLKVTFGTAGWADVLEPLFMAKMPDRKI